MLLRKLGTGFAVAAVALVGSLGSATADGMPGRGYGGACCLSWTGFYVGAHLGYGRSEVDWADVSLTGEPVHNDGRGFLGGGQIGFNWQSGNVVFGVEGTLSRTNIDDDYRSVVVPAAVAYSTDINWIGTVAGRLGFASGPALVYAKAGWATANVQLSGVQTAIPDAFSRDDRRNGWVIGGGFEYLFSRNLSFGVEYNFIDLGSASYAGFTRIGLPYTITDADVEIHTVTARLNFKFGRDDPRPLK
jgi:outer membrane immunogenic protein